jgi:hypothetical protein
MCCLVTTLLLLGPRLVILVWWFMDSGRLSLAFRTWPHPFQLAFPV